MLQSDSIAAPQCRDTTTFAGSYLDLLHLYAYKINHSDLTCYDELLRHPSCEPDVLARAPSKLRNVYRRRRPSPVPTVCTAIPASVADETAIAGK